MMKVQNRLAIVILMKVEPESHYSLLAVDLRYLRRLQAMKVQNRLTIVILKQVKPE